MPRIPEEELVRLKSEIDLAALVRSKGVELKEHGSDLIGLCPFHEDRNPSLVVTPGKNLWHCLGACQSGGSVIDWIMKSEGVSFRHAVELLREGQAKILFASTKPIKKASVPKLPAPVDCSADDQQLLKQVIDYYHEALKKTPMALSYLQKRGINSEEALSTFKLGYADRTLGLRLPTKQRKEGLEIREKLTRLGIYRESGHEHFNGSIIIPVMDEHGNITEIYGRKVYDNLRPGTVYHLYLPGPHKGIWNPFCLAAKEIILCESLIDALSFWVNGFRNVTASYGIEGFTDDHLAAFIQHGIRRVFIAYDRDDAGEKASLKLADKLISEGIECFRVQFPKGMDANVYACKVTPANQSLKILLNSAVWLGKGKAPPVVIASPPQAGEAIQSPMSSQLDRHAPPTTGLAMTTSEQKNKINIPTEMKGEDIEINLGERAYRIRGLAKNLSFEVMKVNLRVSCGEKYHIDTLDLYQARNRTMFINVASQELGIKDDIIKRDLGRVLLKLEELQEERINQTLKPKTPEVILSDEERKEALELLKDRSLFSRILADFEKCGIIGEETNKLVGYLAACSRKLEDPLAVMIQSSSAAGKSALMEAILALMPEEEQVKYSAMTGQSLFYMGDADLKHKILALVEEEGAQRASYALKLLQSEGELTIASTGKDPTTGKLITHEYRVEGPVMIFLTTTAIEIDEELLNRCLVLTVNEDRQQTKAIHRVQRERQTLEGLLARKDGKGILTLHRNAQRLLRPFLVANPYALELTFLDDRTRTRRDHMKYLTLIRVIALLHQYQRPIKQIIHQGQVMEYIEVTLKDIELANKLAHEVLGRTLDELPPQTRRLLQLISNMVKKQCSEKKIEQTEYRFSRKDIRQETGWHDTQLKIHLHRLEDLEYLLIHKGSRGQTFVYELLYRGEGLNGKPFLMGLRDLAGFEKHGYDFNKSGVAEEKSGSSRPQVGVMSGGGRALKNFESPLPSREISTSDEESSETHVRVPVKSPSYVGSDLPFTYLAAKE